MHNLRYYRLNDGSYQLRFFNIPVKDSFPKPKVDYIDTPFSYDDCDLHYKVPLQKDPIASRLESIRCSTSRTRKRIRMLSLSTDDWEYFATFTFNMLEVGNRYDYDNVCQYMQIYLKRLRLRFPDVKYILVPEMHEDGAFHFHGLFSHMDLTYAGRYHKDIVYHDNLFEFGWTDVTKVKDQTSVSHYITKYITKDFCSVSFGKKRYWHSYKTLKPLDEQKINHLIDLLLVKEFLQNLHSRYKMFQYGYVSYLDFTLKPEAFDDLMYVIDQFYNYDERIKNYEKIRHRYRSPGFSDVHQLSFFS